LLSLAVEKEWIGTPRPASPNLLSPHSLLVYPHNKWGNCNQKTTALKRRRDAVQSKFMEFLMGR